jgi:hypothetical protein
MTCERFVALISLAAAIGCASGSKGTTGSGGTTSSGSSTASSGAGVTGGGSTTSTGGSSSSSGYSGVITLSQLPPVGGGFEGTPTLSSASVVFSSGGLPTPACSGTQSGSCCFSPNTSSSGNVTPTSVPAGTIAFTDNGVGIGTVSYGTQAYPPLTSATNKTFGWAAGDMVGVRNGGSTVGRFTGSLAAPQPIASLSPAFSTTTLTTIPLAQDLNLSWAPSGDMQLSFSVSDAAIGSITCSVADSLGTLTVPSTLLGQLGSGDMGSVVITRQNVSTPPLSAANASVLFQIAITTLGSVNFE